MKSRIIKPLAVFLLALIALSASSAFAQQSAKSSGTTQKQPNDQEFKKDYNDKMAKFDQQYSKMKQKEASTNDPAMKADLDNILSKMDACKSDMSRYDAQMNNMSPEQKKQAQENIKTQMTDIHQMSEAAHSKYGGKSGEKNGQKSGSKQGVNESSKNTTTQDAQTKDAQKQKAQTESKGEKKNKTNTEGTNPK